MAATCQESQFDNSIWCWGCGDDGTVGGGWFHHHGSMEQALADCAELGNVIGGAAVGGGEAPNQFFNRKRRQGLISEAGIFRPKFKPLKPQPKRNFVHSNFSHCGARGRHLNMAHKSNFAHNNFAHNNFAHNNFAHNNFAHNNFVHSNFAHQNFVNGGNQDAVFSGGQSNVGPQDRIFAGNYASGCR